MTAFRTAAVLLLICSVGPLAAQVRPVAGNGDPRLQTVAYDPDQVVQLAVATGYQLMISFAGGEHIETIAVGDSAAWQVTANKRGNHLFVKNIMAAADTNLTVITDTRVYYFELVRAYGGGELPYTVRFVYPELPPVVVTPPADQSAYRYRFGGARSIRPSAIDRIGQNIGLLWPANAAMPAMFRIDDDGQETLVNGEMLNGRFMIAGMPDKLVFRLGSLTATAVRTRLRKSPR